MVPTRWAWSQTPLLHLKRHAHLWHRHRYNYFRFRGRHRRVGSSLRAAVTSPKQEDGADMLGVVINPSLALGTTCLCGLTCSNQRHDAFEIKVFHFRPRDSGPRRSRTIQCMSSCREFIFVQSQKISLRNLERFRIYAHLTALGVNLPPPPFIRWGLKNDFLQNESRTERKLLLTNRTKIRTKIILRTRIE